MALSDTEIEKINNLYTQLDALSAKYHAALEDIHNLNKKIVDYADALVKKCDCRCTTQKTADTKPKTRTRRAKATKK